MTSVTEPTTAAIAVVDAPAIPGLTFRPGRDGDWPMVADVVNRVRLSDGIEEILTAEGMVAEYGALDGFRVDRDLLVAELDDVPIGISLGQRNLRDAALVLDLWGAVVPEHRRRGIGTSLHRTARARLIAEADADPRPGPRHLQTFANELERGDIALLLAEGFAPIRFGFEMRRHLARELPEVALPDGLELRPVTLDVVPAILEADNEAFRDHWGHRETTERERMARLDDPDCDIGLWRVAWDGDEVVGSALNAIYRLDNERLGVSRGWLDHVSVRRPWRGLGVAKALCAASLRALRERGIAEAWLGVDASNPTGALQLYEGLGFEGVQRWFAYARPLDGPAPEGWQPEG
jgi:mycothiol synthase